MLFYITLTIFTDAIKFCKIGKAKVFTIELSHNFANLNINLGNAPDL